MCSSPLTNPSRFLSDLDPRSELELLRRSLPNKEEDEEQLKLFRGYVLGKDEAWVLDANVIDLIGRVLDSAPPAVRVRLLKIFAYCSVKEDFVGFIANYDRKQRHLLHYLAQFGQLRPEEQKAALLFLCNLSSCGRGRDWCLYFSGWTRRDTGENTSNATVCCRVAGYALQSKVTAIRTFGVALAFNLSLRGAQVYEGGNSSENGTVLLAHQGVARVLSKCLEDVLGGSKAMSPAQEQMCREAQKNWDNVSSQTSQKATA